MESKYTKSDIEILIATMNRDNLDFLQPMFPYTNYRDFSLVIVNQTNGNPLFSTHENFKIINSSEFGLSKSRNLALANASKELLVISDDDVIFESNFESKIITAFNYYQNPALVKFSSVNDSIKTALPIYKRKTKLNWFDILQTKSIEIVLNKVQIQENNLLFDERFGLGSQFGAGEEQVFLASIQKASLSICFEPQVLMTHKKLSTIDKISIERKYYIQGAVLSAIFQSSYQLWFFLKVFFDCKQGKLSLKEFKLAKREFKKGRTDFLASKI